MTASPSVAAAPERPLSSDQVRQLSVRFDRPGLTRALTHYAAVIAVGALTWTMFVRVGFLATLPLMVLQGVLVAFLFMPLHECAHKTVFRSRAANLVLGHLSGFLTLLPYEYYSLYHWDHHRYTQDPERDPELLTAIRTNSDAKLAIAYTGVRQVLRRSKLFLGHGVSGTVAAPWIAANKRELAVREARLYALGYTALLLLSIAHRTTILLWVWLLPLFIGQLFLRPYLYAEHIGCSRTRTAFENTRTTRTAAVVKWLAWNMPYHAEHHAYPSVPFHALPKLHELVGERVLHVGQSYRAVTGETWRWFRGTRRGSA
jgi:fatty acid desaturase